MLRGVVVQCGCTRLHGVTISDSGCDAWAGLARGLSDHAERTEARVEGFEVRVAMQAVQ